MTFWNFLSGGNKFNRSESTFRSSWKEWVISSIFTLNTISHQNTFGYRFLARRRTEIPGSVQVVKKYCLASSKVEVKNTIGYIVNPYSQPDRFTNVKSTSNVIKTLLNR